MAGRHGIVSAQAGDDLRAVQRSLAQAPAELQRLLDSTAREQLSGAWIDELSKRSPISAAQSRFVLHGAEATPFAGGLLVSTGDPWQKLGRIYEFGTKDREHKTTYHRRGSSKRRAHTVTRHTRRQLPNRKAGGYIAYPAANKLGARVFAMWGQLIRKVLHDATEGNL